MSINENTRSQRARLVERLIQRTKAGSLEWGRSIDEGIYQVSFPQHTVKIRREYRPIFDENEAGASESPCIVVSVHNASGEVLDEFSQFDFRLPFPHENELAKFSEKLTWLFESARKRALNVDQEIDALLQELGG